MGSRRSIPDSDRPSAMMTSHEVKQSYRNDAHPGRERSLRPGTGTETGAGPHPCRARGRWPGRPSVRPAPCGPTGTRSGLDDGPPGRAMQGVCSGTWRRRSALILSAHAGQQGVCHKAAAGQGRQVTESEVPPLAGAASISAGGVTGTAVGQETVMCAIPRDRSLVVVTGFPNPLPPARGLRAGPSFPVAAWTKSAHARVRPCGRWTRAGCRQIPPVLSLRAPGTASKGVAGIACPDAPCETGAAVPAMIGAGHCRMCLR